MPTIWAAANQKGGVGKTCMATHLAHACARAGERVLLVDMDPQASATSVTDAEPEASASSLYEALADGAPLAPAIQPSEAWGFDVAPATLQMARLEQVSTPGAEFVLAEALAPLEALYDRIVIDLPPSLGRLMATGLVAATHALVVTEPSGVALRGISDLLDTISAVRRRYRRGLILAGVVINRVAPTKEAALRVQELREGFGADVWEPVVPMRTAFTTALGAHVPVTAIRDEGGRTAAAAIEALATRMRAMAPAPAAGAVAP